MTARLIAARSAGGVRDPARSSTMASAARASPGSSSAVAPAMIRALYSVTIPDRNAALVPGSLTSKAFGQVQHLIGAYLGQAQRRDQLAAGELIPPLRTRTAADQLPDRGMLTGARVRLDPVPRADGPDQFIVGGARVPVPVPGGVIGEQAQAGAAGGDVQRLAGGEPGGRAGVLAGEALRGARHPRAPAAGQHRSER